jgi:hypothetical protein
MPSQSFLGPGGEQIFGKESVLLIPTDATVDGGMSGGPLLVDNHAIGVISGSLARQGRAFGWAIPSSRLEDLKALNPPTTNFAKLPPLRLLADPNGTRLLKVVNTSEWTIKSQVYHSVLATLESLTTVFTSDSQLLVQQFDAKAATLDIHSPKEAFIAIIDLGRAGLHRTNELITPFTDAPTQDVVASMTGLSSALTGDELMRFAFQRVPGKDQDGNDLYRQQNLASDAATQSLLRLQRDDVALVASFNRASPHWDVAPAGDRKALLSDARSYLRSANLSFTLFMALARANRALFSNVVEAYDGLLAIKSYKLVTAPE